eukprot:m.144908 g.144908  ORF g.144908 m.144908 type:complete len:527 (-) comp30401_c1_seq1:339-1919(-)
MCIFCEINDNDHARVDPLTNAEIIAAEHCPDMSARVEATIITGFLGAGKTTFLNKILSGNHGKRYCVVQNEFGSVSVDDALMVKTSQFSETAVITMPSGCVCCKVRGDLIEGLKSLAQTASQDGPKGHFDGVIIETSGLSEVGPVAQTFFADAFVQRNFRLDSIIAVVDAVSAPTQLISDHPLAQDHRTHVNTTQTSSTLPPTEPNIEDVDPIDNQHIVDDQTQTNVSIGERHDDYDSHKVVPQHVNETNKASLTPTAIDASASAHASECESDTGSDSVSDSDSDSDDSDSDSEDEEAVMLKRDVNQLLLEQISLADTILLSKLDLIAVDKRQTVCDQIKKINPAATVIAHSNTDVQVDIAQVLGTHSFDVSNVLNSEVLFTHSVTKGNTDHSQASNDDDVDHHQHHGEHAHNHDNKRHLHHRFGSVGLERDTDVSELDFCDWLQETLEKHRTRLYRIKGVVYFAGVDAGSVVQCVQSHVEIVRIPDTLVGTNPNGEYKHRLSRLVLIGEISGIETELTQGFQRLT